MVHHFFIGASIMATEKPRITITLPLEQYEVIKRLATLQGGSMSRIVADLLGEVTPVLSRVCDSLEIAKRAQEGVRLNLRKAAQEAEEDMKPLAEIARDQFDRFASELDRLVQAAGESSPRTVITGATESQRGVK
jgi:hypothetical protein